MDEQCCFDNCYGVGNVVGNYGQCLFLLVGYVQCVLDLQWCKQIDEMIGEDEQDVEVEEY